jgi:integration host factor subunit alpha
VLKVSLTKAQIAETIYEETGFTLNKSVAALECILETVKNAMEGGDDVLVSGFRAATFIESHRASVIP